jgi:hypothetical protein
MSGQPLNATKVLTAKRARTPAATSEMLVPRVAKSARVERI